MNSTPSTQRLLLAGAWIGTAVIAYSIGHLSLTPGAVAPGAEAWRGNGAVAPGTDRDGGAVGDQRPLDGARGLATRALETITGGQPLGDYLKRILALDDEIKRTTAFLEVLETLKTPEEIRAALDAVAKSGKGWGHGVASREFSMLLQKWTAFDPKGAAAYAANTKGREERYLATSAVLRTWMRQDLESALVWARANGAPPANDGGAQKEGTTDGNYALAMIVSQLAHTDLDRALTLASEDGNSRVATRLADNLAGELFKQRGEEVAREAILAMPESRLRDAMIGEHADRMAKTDGAGAAQFAAALPPGPARSRALAEAVAGWADDDPAAAGTFLNTLPPSSDSDAARERFARQVIDQDPLGALSWAATITDERERQDTTEKLIRSWVRRDGESAKKWVLQSAFSEETKQRLLTPDKPKGRN